MTAVFDWSGAPEGERWVLGNNPPTVRYVITVDKETGRETAWVRLGDVQLPGSTMINNWVVSARSVEAIRDEGTRVESARPVPRVGDRVRVTRRPAEVTVTGVSEVAVFGRDDEGVARRFDRALCDIEVLQRADPPLQPGDLVRNSEGDVYVYLLDGAPEGAFWPVRIPGRDTGKWASRYARADIPGPLVKVQLTEVHDA